MLLTLTTPVELMPTPPTSMPATLKVSDLPEHKLTDMMNPVFPGVQTSPDGFVVPNTTTPVSGGKVELDNTRSPPVNAIFQPLLPVNVGSVQSRTAREETVVVVCEMVAKLVLATVKVEDGRVEDDGILSVTA